MQVPVSPEAFRLVSKLPLSQAASSFGAPFMEATSYLPGGSDSKAAAYNAGDRGWIPGWGRSPEGNGNPLQYSCLENPMDGGSC